jgi:N-acetylglucosamine malate deacetylase 1
MPREELSLLVFGAHPDDAEIGVGGILAIHAKREPVGICDLTIGDMSSNGTPEVRQLEAKQAAKILGVSTRIQLNLGDRRLHLYPEVIEKVVRVIREYRPKIVLSPSPNDRHPDHEWCFRIVREALFSAGLRNYRLEEDDFPSFKPSAFYQYMINDIHKPSFVIDVTSVYEQKRQALFAYKSQFFQDNKAVSTVLNQGTFLSAIEGRDAVFGHAVGVRYAEGLLSEGPLLLPSLHF